MKKFVYPFFLFFMVLLFVVGCSSAEEEAVEEDAPAADTAADETVDEVAEPAQESVTLTYMASQDWVKEAEMELAVKFEEETGIHIDFQIVPADQYFNLLTTKLNSGEATDIFGGQSGKTDLQVLYNVEENAVDLTDEEWVSRMDPLALEMVSLNGRVYGAEIWDIVASNYFVMVYNKQIFADLGISVPESYADFKAACQTIMDSGTGIIPVSEIRTRQGDGRGIQWRTLCHFTGFRMGAFPVSDFRTWATSHRCEAGLEPQDVAGGQLPLGHRIEPRHPPQQAHGLQLAEVIVQRGPADLAVMRQPVLRGEAAVIRVEPVAKMPEHDLGRGL